MMPQLEVIWFVPDLAYPRIERYCMWNTAWQHWPVHIFIWLDPPIKTSSPRSFWKRSGRIQPLKLRNKYVSVAHF